MYDLMVSRSWFAGLLVVGMATACDVGSKQDGATSAALAGSTASVAASVVPPIHATFPAATCRNGYRQFGPRLCINTNLQAANTYANAVSACRGNRGEVCSYEDLSYGYLNSNLDASYNPDGMWIGNMPADDQVLCGNAAITTNTDADIGNFEGTCAKSDVRGYWCCHDDLE